MISPRIPFSIIKLSGLITLADRVVSILGDNHPGENLLRSSLDKVFQARQVATQAIGSDRGLAGTKTVTAADDDRDDSFDSLKYHIKAGLKRLNPAYREACERLYTIFRRNGLGISKLPYDEESGALASLFEDLNDAEAQADLTTINAMEWLEELKDAQANFEEAVLARGEERVLTDTPTHQEAITTLTPAIKSLFKVLDVAEENELIADVGETIELINGTIAEIVTAHRRGTVSDGNGVSEEREI